MSFDDDNRDAHRPPRGMTTPGPTAVALSDIAHIQTSVDTKNLLRVYTAMAQGRALPPIELSFDRRTLRDGNHRLTSARLLGHTTIAAVFTSGDRLIDGVHAKHGPDTDVLAIRYLRAAVEFIDGPIEIGSMKQQLRSIIRDARRAHQIQLPTFSDPKDAEAALALIRWGLDASTIVITGIRMLDHLSRDGGSAQVLNRILAPDCPHSYRLQLWR